MKHLSQKIKSNKGATLLIAIVFMLFCVFIGGSVLAAATANGSRVDQALDDEQSYLSQRSAALIVAEELRSVDPVRLNFHSEGQTISFEFPEDSSTLRQLTYLCAAYVYRLNHLDFSAYSLDSIGFDKLININTLVTENGTGCYADFTLNLATAAGPLETRQARMYCDMSYKISVVFPDEEGARSTLHLEMDNSTFISGQEDSNDPSGDFWVQLYWAAPEVVKGGGQA